MSFLHSIILGIVEGVTEFLPISSTGHLMLTSTLLKIQQTDFQKSFDIVIQLGAILSVVVLYWRRLWEWGTIKKLFVAFVPTAILGLAFYKVVKSYLLGSDAVVLWALLLGGVFLVGFEWWCAKRKTPSPLTAGLPLGEREITSPSARPACPVGREGVDALASGGVGETISYTQSFIIGLFQSLAMIPGVSRSAATIVGGLLLGLKRKTIVEFSFLLAVPTMLAASALDLYKSAGNFASADWAPLAVGFVVSFLVAMVAIKWLLRFIQKNSFIGFGIYRIVVAVLFWWLVM